MNPLPVGADRILVERIEAPPILVGRCEIGAGDEHALRPDEALAFQSAVASVRRQSGTARLIARSLLGLMGEPAASILRSASRAPVWPSGIVGSLAHDEKMAAAAVGRVGDVAAVGIDIEPDDPLPPDLIAVVATPAERRRYSPAILASRRLFVAKEAVFKATFPVDAVFLDFHDIDVDLAAGVATLNSGRRVSVRFRPGERLVALAHIDREPPG